MIVPKSIGKYISILYRQQQCYINKELEPYGISSGQFIFLNILYHKDGINQEEISNLLNIDKGTTARAIKKLEKTGYISRKTDPKDHRAQLVFLTEKAYKIRGKIYKVLKNWTQILISDFSEEDKEKTIKLLEAMTRNIDLYYKRKADE
ncbi:MarR family winged helix-turn-helix transcriptional regulator [Defluviitalea phaphyphila]|uniref:MarR family winged helix-turn-helix transcriptional regulator n=1 Tax=Defluviitalea phaphyphila TaxID=1473580 RepID=UPI0007317762|nr:MarR family transcriptional regulator [Defluviitalea phaphyphila]